MKKRSSRALPNEATKLRTAFLFPKMGPNRLLFLPGFSGMWFDASANVRIHAKTSETEALCATERGKFSPERASKR